MPTGYDICPDEVDSDGDDEGVVGEVLPKDGDRIGLEKEDEVLRKIKDPRLPSQAEVDSHYLCGHIPYRSWCEVCVRARGKELDHQKDQGKERALPE